MEKTFESVVKTMTAKEIIMAMVDSLTPPPAIKIEMGTFGDVIKTKGFLGLFKKEICIGCAATNTICKISGVKFTPENINGSYNRAEALNTNLSFLTSFEYAINALRTGNIAGYNHHAKEKGIAEIKEFPAVFLPLLRNDYKVEDLTNYKLLADLQP